LAYPSLLEYWHIGETNTRLANFTSLIASGSNRPAICIPFSYFVSNPDATDEQSSIYPNSVIGKPGPPRACEASSYLERGSAAHLDRSTEKSFGCAIAPDLLEQDIWAVTDMSLKQRTTWDGGK
jgi:hypothetical protein